jgi:ribosomal protein L21E
MEDQMSNYRKGQRVKAVTSIQRTSGAAWHGDEGEIVGETGDGYRVRFKGGFVAENVQEHDIKEA